MVPRQRLPILHHRHYIGTSSLSLSLSLSLCIYIYLSIYRHHVKECYHFRHRNNSNSPNAHSRMMHQVKVHYHSRRSASVLAVSILSTCVVIVMYLSYQHNLNFYSPDQQNMIYDKPYTRAQTYMIGVLAGFFLNSQWGNYIPSLKVANGLTLAALVVRTALITLITHL